MAQITIPDAAFAQICAVAASRNETPEALLVKMAQELDDDRIIAPPMNEEEFAAVLGIKPEDLPELDRKAAELLASLT